MEGSPDYELEDMVPACQPEHLPKKQLLQDRAAAFVDPSVGGGGVESIGQFIYPMSQISVEPCHPKKQKQQEVMKLARF